MVRGVRKRRSEVVRMKIVGAGILWGLRIEDVESQAYCPSTSAESILVSYGCIDSGGRGEEGH